MSELNTDNNNKTPMMRHSRSNDFQTKLVTGSVANVLGDRVELSFYNETAVYSAEKLIAVEGIEGEFQTSGEIATTMIREHTVGVSVNFEQLEQLHELIGRIVADNGKKS